MMTKSKTQNFALLKMAFILPLAMVLALIFSASVSERIIAQESMSDKELKAEQFKQQKQESDVYTEVEKMPEYPGGDDARIKFLVENIKYPAEARKNGVRGTVFVAFIVEKDGEISNVKALKGIGGGCDEEAVRVISMMPNWKPGMQKGKPVRVQFNMPIKFNLDHGGEKEVKKGEEKKDGVPPPPPKSDSKKNEAPPPPPPPQSE
ncbi:MAG: energy transducer TonB [Bacteroidales bacterium]